MCIFLTWIFNPKFECEERLVYPKEITASLIWIYNPTLEREERLVYPNVTTAFLDLNVQS